MLSSLAFPTQKSRDRRGNTFMYRVRPCPTPPISSTMPAFDWLKALQFDIPNMLDYAIAVRRKGDAQHAEYDLGGGYNVSILVETGWDGNWFGSPAEGWVYDPSFLSDTSNSGIPDGRWWIERKPLPSPEEIQETLTRLHGGSK